MRVIGIVGGIASGKSSVAECFRRFGAEVIHADRIGHEILNEADVKQALGERWGQMVFDESGNVDRAAVARRVFGPPPEGPAELAYLEQLTHPRIERSIRLLLSELASRSNVETVVMDAPVLLKAGWDAFCDSVLFVEASRNQRLKRALQRGWSEAEFSAREGSQESLDEKRKRADWVIDNSGSPEDMFVQVQQFWRSLG